MQHDSLISRQGLCSAIRVLAPAPAPPPAVPITTEPSIATQPTLPRPTTRCTQVPYRHSPRALLGVQPEPAGPAAAASLLCLGRRRTGNVAVERASVLARPSDSFF